MLIKRLRDIPSSEITPKTSYMNRRTLLIGTVAGAVGLTVRTKAGWLQPRPVLAAEVQLENVAKSAYSTNEAPTPRELVTTYNNFYEFGGSKADPARNAGKFQTSPWSVSVEGEVAKPRTFTVDEISKLAPLEERIYRHRCVEGWSIVVPSDWVLVQCSSEGRAANIQSALRGLSNLLRCQADAAGRFDWPSFPLLRGS